MPHSSSRRCIHHGDTAAGSMPVTGRRPNRMTPVPGWMVSGHASPSAGSGGDVGRVDVVEVVGARDFAGHAAHRQAVAAVRGDRQVEHHVVEPEHIGGGVAGFGGAWRQHDDAGLVGAEVEFGRRADHAVGVRPYVLREAMVKSPGSVVPGSATATRSPTAKFVAPQTMSRNSDSPTSTLTGPDGLLELGELLDLGDPADGQRARNGADRDDLFDLVADADQRLFQLVGCHVPARRAGPNDLTQPAVGNAHQAPTPNGSENRTSPSTMSRMSGMPLRNCRVRSRPMPNANPEYRRGRCRRRATRSG